MTAVLEVAGLSAGYGRIQVLHGIDLTLRPGRITALLGANGAGKTTLLRTVSGLRRPTAGSVRLRGGSLASTPVERLITLGLAHVPEGRGVIAELTVEENLRLGGMWRTGRSARRETSRAVADMYDLFEPLARRRTHRGHQLSGGERQLLAIGRALVARPSVLLLDEPSLGLAPAATAQIMALLRTLCDATELAVLLAEQNAAGALDIADDGVVIALGRVAATGPAAELRADDRVRRAYLGF